MSRFDGINKYLKQSILGKIGPISVVKLIELKLFRAQSSYAENIKTIVPNLSGMDLFELNSFYVLKVMAQIPKYDCTVPYYAVRQLYQEYSLL